MTLSLIYALLLVALILPSDIQRLQRHASCRTSRVLWHHQIPAEHGSATEATPTLKKLQLLPGGSRLADGPGIQFAQRLDRESGRIARAPCRTLGSVALGHISVRGMLLVLLVGGGMGKARLRRPP